MRPVTILLAGEFYSENLGDPLLCRTVESILKERWPQATIVPFDLTGRTGPGSFFEAAPGKWSEILLKKASDRFLYYRRAAILRFMAEDKARHQRVWYALKELRRQYRFDMVVFAGGSLFMDYFAGIIYEMVCAFAFSQTKIVFHACGMSTLSQDGEYLLARALRDRHVVSISLRDSYDRFVSLFPVRGKTIETFDTALGCSLSYAPTEKKRAEFGLGLIDRREDLQIPLIRALLRSGKSWMAFTNGSPYDQEYGKKLLLQAGIPEEELAQYLLPRPTTVETLVAYVTGFEKLVAFRMHSQIVAASFGVPSFGFGWDDKIGAFYEKLGFPQGCTGESMDLGSIEEILSQYGQLRPRALEQGRQSRECLIGVLEKHLGRRGRG